VEQLPQAPSPQEPLYWREEPQPQVQPVWAQQLARLASAQQEPPYPLQVLSPEPPASVVLLQVARAQEPLRLVQPPGASAPL